MRAKLIILIFVLIATQFLAVGFSAGVKIHGHIEPYVSVSFENELMGVQLKSGFIFDNTGIAVVVPGVFLYKDLNSWRLHIGLEGLIHLEEKRCLLLARAGVNYGFETGLGKIFLGGEVGFPIELPGEFFVKGDLMPIPTLTVSIDF